MPCTPIKRPSMPYQSKEIANQKTKWVICECVNVTPQHWFALFCREFTYFGIQFPGLKMNLAYKKYKYQLWTGVELSKIIRETNCMTPCNYNEYKLARNPPRPLTDEFGNETVFGLLAISENTEFQEEVLLYPRSKSENIILYMKCMPLDCQENSSARLSLTIFCFVVDWLFLFSRNFGQNVMVEVR